MPLNVELEVRYGEHARAALVAGALDTWVLRDAESGDEVLLMRASTGGRLRPVSPLLPEHTYELLAPGRIEAEAEGCAPSGELVVVSTFVTGTEPDLTPPAAPVILPASCRAVSCESSTCCGPYVAQVSSITWSAEDDVPLPLAYALGGVSGAHSYAEHAVEQSLSSGLGTAIQFLPRLPRSDGSAAVLFAIDASGNVSEATPLPPFDFSCASRPDAETAPDPAPGTSCAATPGAPRATPLLALLFLALAAMRRYGRVDPRARET